MFILKLNLKLQNQFFWSFLLQLKTQAISRKVQSLSFDDDKNFWRFFNISIYFKKEVQKLIKFKIDSYI